MRGDQIVAHVARMAGRVAQPLQSVDPRQMADEIGERARAAVGAGAVIAVDVLPEQRHLAHAARNERARLALDVGDAARILHAARVWHDAERTELVAAFLHGEERRHCAASALAAAGAANFSSSGNVVSTSERSSARVPGNELGQSMIALRSDDEIDGRRAAHDLGALGLRHAADDGDHRLVAGGGALVLQVADAAEIGIDLLRRLLADVAGVENDEIGVLDGVGFA